MDTEEQNQNQSGINEDESLSIEDSDEQPAFLGDEDFEEVVDVGDGQDLSEESSDMEEEIPDESTKQFTTHSDAVYSVCFSPSAPTLVATGGGDDMGTIWDASTGELKYKLEGHSDTVTKVAFSNNGELLATCGMDACIKIWDPVSGQLVHTLEGPGESLDCCAWHPRGPVILAGSGDGTAWMWNGKTGTMMNVFAGHSDAVVACSFTSDGSKVVTASADKTIRVWDPKTAQVIHTIKDGGALPFHAAPLTCMKCHPEHQQHQQPNHDINGEQQQEQQQSYIDLVTLTSTQLRQHLLRYQLYSLRLEKDGVVSGSGEGVVSVCNTTTGKVLNVYREHSDSIEDILFLSFLPCVASASLDSSVHIWDINTLQTRTKHQLSAGVTRLVSCPEAPNVIIAGCLDGTVNVIDARAGKVLKTLTGHTEEVLDLAISGKMVVSASEDHTVRLWDIAPYLAESK